MSIETEFFTYSFFTSLFSLVFFSIPGLWLCALLGIELRNSKASALLICPALGMSCFGAFSLIFTWLAGFSVLTILAAWVTFQLISAGILFGVTRITSKQVLVDIKPGALFLLLLAVGTFGILPVINIYPALYKGGLFVNYMIYDHVKMAIVTGIAREGLPPINPYYAPLGERIQLIYYYGWHFLAAQIKLISGISVWYAEIALMWTTAFATVAFLIMLAIRFTGKLIAGWLIILLSMTSMLPDLLTVIFGGRSIQWLGYPPGEHPLELLALQLSWAPQHVYSAMCIILMFFLLSRMLTSPEHRCIYAVIIGLTAAMGFNASVWIGGIGLIWALPWLLYSLWHLKLDYSMLVRPFIIALATCIIFAAPVLLAELSGPPAEHFPLTFKAYTATSLLNQKSILQKVGHIVLFWVQFLPLNLGIVFLIGFPAVFAYAPGNGEGKVFKFLSMSAIIAYLSAVQFIQSIVGSNDFGWRCVNIPVLLMMVWAAIALTELPSKLNQLNWRPNALLVRFHSSLIPIASIGLTLGILSTFYLWHLPKPHDKYGPPDEVQLSWHQDLFKLREAWNLVLLYTKPNELVQANPNTYSRVMTYSSAPTAMVLFGDRPMAYADPDSVQTFAHPYDKAQKAAQYAAVLAIFANPKPKDLLYARDTLHIKALIVDKRDEVWSYQTIEKSGIYKLVEQRETFKIFVAV